jgi:CrcB protein
MNPLRDFLLVAMGGGLGAMTRYAIGLGTQYALGKHFAWGTLIANVLGCLLVGVVGQRVLYFEPPAQGDLTHADPATAHFLRVAVMVGFLGGLTTFSAFGWDTMSGLLDRRPGAQLLAFVNVGANLLLGLAAVWLGIQLGRSFPSASLH